MFRVLCLVALLAGSLAAQDARTKLDIIPDNAGAVGVLRFCESADWLTAPNNTACSGFKAPATITTPYDLTLPPALPGSTACITTTAAGVLAFDTTCSGSGGAVAGSDRDIQINSTAVHGVSSEVFRLDTNNALVLQHSAGDAAILMQATRTTVAAPVGQIQYIGYDGTQFNAGFVFRGVAVGGTPGAETATTTNEFLFELQGGGHSGSAFRFNQATYRIAAAGNWSATSQPTRHMWFTTDTGSTTNTQRWQITPPGDFEPQADGAYDIATSSVRVGNAFMDRTNAEFLEIENAGHTAHFTIQHDASGLFFKDTAGANMLQFDGNSIIAHEAVIRGNSAEGTHLGTAGTPFGDVWGNILYVEGPDSALPYVFRAFQGAGGGRVELGDDDPLDPPEVVAALGADSSSNGELRLSSDGGSLFVHLFSASSDGRGLFYNSAGTLMVEIGEGAGGATEDNGSILIYDSSARNKINFGYDSGGDPVISMLESGAGTDEEIRLEARAADDNHDSLSINDGSGVAMIRMGVENSEGRAAFHNSSGTVRAIIGSDSGNGFVNVNAGASRNVLLTTSATASDNRVYINDLPVLGPRGAAVADADGTLASATSQLNALLSRLRTHGVIAP